MGPCDVDVCRRGRGDARLATVTASARSLALTYPKTFHTLLNGFRFRRPTGSITNISPVRITFTCLPN
jgi:hypothetical protein